MGLVACLRNVKAFTLFRLAWLGVFLMGGILITTVAALTGSAEVVAVAMVPAALLMAAMFFTSIYFTFRDSFMDTGDDSHDPAHP